MVSEFMDDLVKPPFLGGLTAAAFLDQYWQKQSLMVANAFPQLVDCIEPNELAGYSLEDSIESRIIIEKASNQWELLHGPFDDATFTSLPNTHWTLLVQAVDHYFQPFASLLDQFNFLPQWRIDDIMMSYATTGGNVGPHYDYYDVFLIQVSGQRCWKTGQFCNDKSPLVSGLPVRILETFDTQSEHVVNPGDVLYIPPGMAHHGVALDDNCITLSVGFRAPSHADILSEYSHFLAEKLPGHQRYHDTDLKPRIEPHHHSGMISNNDVKRIKQQMLAHFSDENNIQRWMAEYLSLPKYEHNAPITTEINAQEIPALLNSGASLQRDESSRFVTITQDSRTLLFINGCQQPTNNAHRNLVHLICSKRVLLPLDLFSEAMEKDTCVFRCAVQ